MSKYYSLDLCQRAAAYGLQHGSVEAAALFDISRATAARWASQMRKTGKVSIGKVGGHKRAMLEGQEPWFRERVSSETHVTLRRLQSELAERGIVVNYGAVWKFVHRLGLSFKKSFYAEEATRPDVAAGGVVAESSGPHRGLTSSLH